MNAFNPARIRAAAEAKRLEEQQRFPLAVEIIERGYKAAAAKHHPDTGGDASNMARLQELRDWLLLVSSSHFEGGLKLHHGKVCRKERGRWRPI